MVVDSSAALAILLGEPEAELFSTLLADAEDPLISAATLVEASIVIRTKLGDAGVEDLDALLATAAVRCVALDLQQARIARNAYARYGKGQSPAGLNLGDCFSYALATVYGRPLLFKGDDFSQTDVTVATRR